MLCIMVQWSECPGSDSRFCLSLALIKSFNLSLSFCITWNFWLFVTETQLGLAWILEEIHCWYNWKGRGITQHNGNQGLIVIEAPLSASLGPHFESLLLQFCLTVSLTENSCSRYYHLYISNCEPTVLYLLKPL